MEEPSWMLTFNGGTVQTDGLDVRFMIRITLNFLTNGLLYDRFSWVLVNQETKLNESHTHKFTKVKWVNKLTKQTCICKPC